LRCAASSKTVTEEDLVALELGAISKNIILDENLDLKIALKN
jgi:hypothetical protein